MFYIINAYQDNSDFHTSVHFDPPELRSSPLNKGGLKGDIITINAFAV